jgi:hypothetical protein
VHGSEIAHRALQASCEPVRPEAVGNWTKPDRLDAVLALVVGDLARSWTRRIRTRGPSSASAAEAPTSEFGVEIGTVELSQQQSARMAGLPEDYRVVGVERRTPLVRKPTGQIIRIQQNGRMTAATIAARRKLAAAARRRTANYEGDASWHESS